ncbi:PHD finger protein 20-like protein 1 [Arapaima gigas]
MSKKPPVRPGITFQVGARVEAQDYLQKWYPSRIEKIDYERGKMLVHFDRWSHRYDEWIFWDSDRLRPLEKLAPQKVGQNDKEETSESLGEMMTSRFDELPGSSENTEDQNELQQRQHLKDGEEVLARWTDCRYYPAKIETVHDDGTYTVQFYDGVVRCVKRIHIKSMPEDAKGQDWIALVKAATDAARGKGGTRPRNSANSKAKEPRRTGAGSGRCDSEVEEDMEVVADPEPDPEKPVAVTTVVEDESNLSQEKLEMAKTKRRKSRQRSLFFTRRPRPRKKTASKVTSEESPQCKEEQKGHPALPDGLCGNLDETHEPKEPAPSVQHPSAQGYVPCLPAPTAPRDLDLKQESKEPDRSQMQSRFAAGLACAEQEAVLVPGQGSGPSDLLVHCGGPVAAVPDTRRTSESRRRSQRLAPFTSGISFRQTRMSPVSQEQGNHEPKQCQGSSAESESQDPSIAGRCDSPPLDPGVHLPSEASSPSALPFPTQQLPVTGGSNQSNADVSNHIITEKETTLLAADAGLKVAARTLKPNKHTREPIINMKRSDGSTSPKELLIDLDHNKFRCSIPGCGKAFRKAKLLDYHLKYYHNADKEVEPETGSPEVVGRARAASASMPTSSLLEPMGSKRRRTVSSSSSLSPQCGSFQLDSSESCSKPPKFRLIKTEKKIKLEEIPTIGKRKDRDKERKDKKEKFPFRIKQKKKKKKKKKSKQHNFEDMSLAFMRRCSSPPNHLCSTSFRLHSDPRHRTFQYPRAILSVDLTGENLSDINSLADSTTESALLSGDEYRAADSSDLEPTAAEDEEYAGDIVRCICEMDEENGFMIQCEECMCWQHSVCMGLLEDCIPDQYLCYVCQDPPGQRLSAKYRHDKDWMTKGHMYGLSFLTDNYSHSNAEKIVSTHQLLADVYSVNKVLHGLHLKMDILQNKCNPNLHLWARSWVGSSEDQAIDGQQDCVHLQGPSAHMDTYITSEHSYQKPPAPGPRCDREAGIWPSQGVLSPADFTSHVACHTVPMVKEEEQERTVIAVPGCPNENFSEDSSDQAKNCVQWQLNLLAHIEDVQSQLASRMDLIEKELDVLESWLDFTGELEPPDPLARLPQLKRRVKQLLTDLGKIHALEHNILR